MSWAADFFRAAAEIVVCLWLLNLGVNWVPDMKFCLSGGWLKPLKSLSVAIRLGGSLGVAALRL
jgi:hypothetical protein